MTTQKIQSRIRPLSFGPRYGLCHLASCSKHGCFDKPMNYRDLGFRVICNLRWAQQRSYSKKWFHSTRSLSSRQICLGKVPLRSFGFAAMSVVPILYRDYAFCLASKRHFIWITSMSRSFCMSPTPLQSSFSYLVSLRIFQTPEEDLLRIVDLNGSSTKPPHWEIGAQVGISAGLMGFVG